MLSYDKEGRHIVENVNRLVSGGIRTYSITYPIIQFLRRYCTFITTPTNRLANVKNHLLVAYVEAKEMVLCLQRNWILNRVVNDND